MLRMKPGSWIAVFAAVCPVFWGGVAAVAADFSLKGQASAWLSLNLSGESTPRFGLRYIPSLSLGTEAGPRFRLDAELSANAYAAGSAPEWKAPDVEGRIKPYRMWVRLSSPRFELRAGLQKINFGSASIFRPLMWFDRVDARDPLQITDGVWGLLVRSYFPGDANLWIWGLAGNDSPKGWETAPTRRSGVEYGGRFQVPLLTGELAATYHRRTADYTGIDGPFIPPIPGDDPFVPEDRYGIDGKWDAGIGVWFEGVLVHQAHELHPFPYQRLLTLGADYTFGLGNGLHVLAEHFVFATAAKAFSGGEDFRFSALALRYPVGLLDNLAAFVYFDWTNEQFFRFLSWQRTYDRWQFFLIGFWNPESSPFFRIPQGNNYFAGAGFQLMAVFNH